MARRRTIVIALGGNALIRPGQRGTAQEQLENVRTPMGQVAELCDDYNIVITHGNGPQVGDLLLQQEASHDVAPMPLGILVAGTQGQIGFMIESALDEALMRRGIMDSKLFVTVLTYVKVAKNDPAFERPTKPIGPCYADPRPGFVQTPKGWRRVVPSPRPVKIYQWREIKRLIQQDFIVIACGGGGVPVIKEGDRLETVDAVIDKDLASATLGEQIGADVLLIATDEPKVALNYRKPDERRLDRLSTEKAKRYLREGQFPEGSMGPKVQAAVHFVESGGEKAIITSIDTIAEALAGRAGTHIFL